MSAFMKVCHGLAGALWNGFRTNLVANAYEAGVDEGESFIPVLKFETFWEMVRPCLCEEATKADVDAILKRAIFLVNTKQFVYYRKNGVNDDQVPR